MFLGRKSRHVVAGVNTLLIVAMLTVNGFGSTHLSRTVYGEEETTAEAVEIEKKTAEDTEEVPEVSEEAAESADKTENDEKDAPEAEENDSSEGADSPESSDDGTEEESSEDSTFADSEDSTSAEESDDTSADPEGSEESGGQEESTDSMGETEESESFAEETIASSSDASREEENEELVDVATPGDASKEEEPVSNMIFRTTAGILNQIEISFSETITGISVLFDPETIEVGQEINNLNNNSFGVKAKVDFLDDKGEQLNAAPAEKEMLYKNGYPVTDLTWFYTERARYETGCLGRWTFELSSGCADRFQIQGIVFEAGTITVKVKKILPPTLYEGTGTTVFVEPIPDSNSFGDKPGRTADHVLSVLDFAVFAEELKCGHVEGNVAVDRIQGNVNITNPVLKGNPDSENNISYVDNVNSEEYPILNAGHHEYLIVGKDNTIYCETDGKWKPNNRNQDQWYVNDEVVGPHQLGGGGIHYVVKESDTAHGGVEINITSVLQKIEIIGNNWKSKKITEYKENGDLSVLCDRNRNYTYVNIPAEKLTKSGKFIVGGLDAGKVLVVNVDVPEGTKEITFGRQLYTDLYNQVGEWNEVSHRIIWNFGSYGGIVKANVMQHGAFIAPEGTVYSANGNTNGVIIAKRAVVTADGADGEFHKMGMDLPPEDPDDPEDPDNPDEPYVGNLKVTKMITGEGASEAEEFEFSITLKGHEAAGIEVFGGMQFENGKITFKLHGGESQIVTGLPAGTQYTVEETDSRGYTVIPSTGKIGGEIERDKVKIAEFVNSIGGSSTGSLEIKKTITGEGASEAEEFGFSITLEGHEAAGIEMFGEMRFENGKASFKLHGGESQIVPGLPIGTQYTVKETDSKGYTVKPSSGEIKGEIKRGIVSKADFENHIDGSSTGSLVIRKTITGEGASEADEFEFSITLEGHETAGTETFGGMQFENGKASIKLHGGESQRVTDLPIGTKYIVEETDRKGYTVTPSSGTIAGEIQRNIAGTAEFNNHMDGPLTGSLEIRKIITGEGASEADEFGFSITLRDHETAGTETFGGMQFENGKANFKLHGGESQIVTDLPAGTQYTVKETDSKGYTITPVSGEITGEIQSGSMKTVTFNNHKGSTTESTPETPPTPTTPTTPTTPINPPRTPREPRTPQTPPPTTPIPPSDVPLAGFPDSVEIEDEPVPLTIMDNPVPLVGIPKLGDMGSEGYFLGMMAALLAFATALGRYRKLGGGTKDDE